MPNVFYGFAAFASWESRWSGMKATNTSSSLSCITKKNTYIYILLTVLGRLRGLRLAVQRCGTIDVTPDRSDQKIHQSLSGPFRIGQTRQRYSRGMETR